VRQYDVYVLRLWRRDGPDGAQWAGRLEHLQDGEVLRFSAPEPLLAHLRRVVSAVDQQGALSGAPQADQRAPPAAPDGEEHMG
jgi:hypothetical protein